MNFFEHQSAARKRAALLVVLYLCAVFVIIPLVYVTMLGIAVPVRATLNFFRSWYDFDRTFTPVPHPGWWDATLFYRVTAITVLLIIGGTVYQLHKIAKGGYVVAEMLGGRPVPPDTKDPGAKRLINVVEEMAIATGIPVPSVYLLRELGINAFAAGFNPDDTVIGVTSGCLDVLTRDELQGVIAHEFSHIRNGDTRSKTMLFGMLHGIEYLGDLSARTVREAIHGEPVMTAVCFIALTVFGVVTIPLLLVTQSGVALTNIIKRMHSRQLEFHADAAAVQFTRNPDAVAGALKKVGGYAPGSYVLNLRDGSARHFFFARALRAMVMGWPLFSSHPPLITRIRRIDQGFSGQFTAVSSRYATPQEPLPAIENDDIPEPATVAARENINTPDSADRTEADGSVRVNPAAVIESINVPTAEHLAQAAVLLTAIPPLLADSIRRPRRAQNVIYAMLMSRNPSFFKAQWEILLTGIGAGAAAEVQRLMLVLSSAQKSQRLPTAILAVRSLKGLPAAAYVKFRDTVKALAAAGDNDNRFAFVLQRMLMRHLAPAFEATPKKKRPAQDHAPLSPIRLCRDLLSCLAYWGTYDILKEEQAFKKGMARFAGANGSIPEMLARDECSLAKMEAALDGLARTAPAVRQKVLEACVNCIAADGRITASEEEMLHAVADALDCPVPPVPSKPGHAPDNTNTNRTECHPA